MAKRKRSATPSRRTKVERPDREPQQREELSEFWLDKLHAAEEHRKKDRNADSQWESARPRYEGIHWQGKNFGKKNSSRPADFITVNLTGSVILDQVAFLFYNDIKWKAQALLERYSKKQRECAALMNKEWTDNLCNEQFEEACFNMVVDGTGIMQIGYTTEIDESKNPELDGGQVNPEWIKVDTPWVEAIDNENFIPDPDAPKYDLETATWCAKIFYISWSELVSRSGWNKEVQDKILRSETGFTPKTETNYMEDNAFTMLKGHPDEELLKRRVRMVKMYEVFDLKYDNYLIYADGVTDHLDRQRMSEKFAHIERFPFVIGKLIPAKKSFWGLGLTRWVEDQQDQLNFNRTFQFRHVRRFSNRRFLYRKGSLSEKQMAAISSGKDGAYGEVKGDPRSAVFVIDDASVPGDTYASDSIIKEDFRELTGSDELSRSGNLPGRTTAREIQARTGYFGAKLNAKKKHVKRFASKTGLQFWQNIQRFMTKERVVKLAGADGEQWVTLTDADIVGQFEIDLEPLEKPDTDPDLKRELFASVMGYITANLPLIYPALAQEGVQLKFSRLLARYFVMMEIDNPEEFYEEVAKRPWPVTDQMAQAMALMGGMGGAGGQQGGQTSRNPIGALPGRVLGGSA